MRVYRLDDRIVRRVQRPIAIRRGRCVQNPRFKAVGLSAPHLIDNRRAFGERRTRVDDTSVDTWDDEKTVTPLRCARILALLDETRRRWLAGVRVISVYRDDLRLRRSTCLFGNTQLVGVRRPMRNMVRWRRDRPTLGGRRERASVAGVFTTVGGLEPDVAHHLIRLTRR